MMLLLGGLQKISSMDEAMRQNKEDLSSQLRMRGLAASAHLTVTELRNRLRSYLGRPSTSTT